jgi:hypothetical protein
MRLVFDLQGSQTLVDAFSEIESLTDKAEMDLDLVQYDKELQRVSLPIHRRAVKGHKTGLFRSRPQTVYDVHERIDSVVIVDKVAEFQETRLFSDEVKTIIILFGLKINKDTISVVSADEISGQVVYRLRIKVKDLDLRLEDHLQGERRD